MGFRDGRPLTLVTRLPRCDLKLGRRLHLGSGGLRCVAP
ncbi:MAG: hypothetical protein QOH12_98 [Solirubrobacteraceae bacterium]|nr:hypothetical protein [Solirubrobacteraceae bacterium]